MVEWFRSGETTWVVFTRASCYDTLSVKQSRVCLDHIVKTIVYGVEDCDIIKCSVKEMRNVGHSWWKYASADGSSVEIYL